MTDDLRNRPAQSNSTIDSLKIIWISVLQRDDVDIHEHFLDLGGDSLSAMLCISRIRAELGVEFSVEEFFMDDATVSSFASIIDEQHLSKHL